MRIKGWKLGARGADGHRHATWRRHTHGGHGDWRLLVDEGLWEAGYFSGAVAWRAGQGWIDRVVAHVSRAACTAHQLSVGHVRQSKSVWCRMHYQHAAAVHNKSVRRGWLAARSTLRDVLTCVLSCSSGRIEYWVDPSRPSERDTVQFTDRAFADRFGIFKSLSTRAQDLECQWQSEQHL